MVLHRLRDLTHKNTGFKNASPLIKAKLVRNPLVIVLGKKNICSALTTNTESLGKLGKMYHKEPEE